jgi:xanthine dehydrogenase YagR molybdenum-binding subunit
MSSIVEPRELLADSVGTARPRVEGQAKVAGAARYAADVAVPDLSHGAIVTTTISRGHIRGLDTSAAIGLPGVVGVIDHTNAPRLRPAGNAYFGPDGSLQLLQDAEVPHAGRPVALVVAETLEQAQDAAEAVQMIYDDQAHDIVLRPDHPAVRAALSTFGPDAELGDIEAELAASDVTISERYRTPQENCGAMELHSATAWWEGDHLEAIDTNQGPFVVGCLLAQLFGLAPDQIHIRAEHVGGGFGAKGVCGPQLILAVMGATVFQRPVRVTLTRNQVFLATSQRPATDQMLRLGADKSGRLRAIEHKSVFEVSPLAEWIENCNELSKTLYAAPAIHTTLSVVPLDVLPPNAMRGPGSTPGSFALESAMDELADKLGIDPLELRIMNEPNVGPVSGLPFASRNLIPCLREGARRFGWATRDHRPRMRREGPLLTGTGLAATSFLNVAFPSSASITAEEDGTFTVTVGATDIGQGARTALTAIAADALGVPSERIRVRIADNAFGPAWAAGGSAGTASWAWAIMEAAAKLLVGADGSTLPVTVTGDSTQTLANQNPQERHAYSAIFAEVTVELATGEVRVRRLLGMFAIGRVINPLLARSQLIGGMTMGLSMALHEENVRDPNTGRQVNADFAGYHVAANADVPEIEVDFVPDYEPDFPAGIKGAGEIGTVGTAAAIANAVWHATGSRQRTLPIRLDRVVEERIRGAA